MKVIAIIPARYSSSRFPGKPLADICGKPMIWWVYNQVKQIKQFSDVFVAIDDNRIEKVCQDLDIKYVMTSNNHPDHISRIHEVSNMIQSDYYICINGDEPLISAECIEPIIPTQIDEEMYFCGAMRKLSIPSETIDSANIKIVADANGRCIYMSRTPIPYPKGSLTFYYNKYVGVECFTKKGLDFFVSTPMGNLEKIEDIDHLRFIENNIPIYFRYVNSESISVDTPKDLEKVRMMIQENLHKAENL